MNLAYKKQAYEKIKEYRKYNVSGLKPLFSNTPLICYEDLRAKALKSKSPFTYS
jgi:hypothetical protein